MYNLLSLARIYISSRLRATERWGFGNNTIEVQ